MESMPAPMVSADELREFVKQGLDVHEMAELTGMKIRSLQNRLSKLGLSPAKPNRKWAVPGQVRIADEDKNTQELRHLWILAAIADGERRDLVRVTMARNWATSLIEAGMDIRYDRTKPRGERWVIIDADPNAWHIKMVLESAKAGRRLSLADVA
jgi:hypothetical protein